MAARAAGPLPALAGPTLSGVTHLRLLVGDTPPVVLDVDAKTVTTISGIVGEPRIGGPAVTGVRPALGGAFVTVTDGGTVTGYFVSADDNVRTAGSAANLILARSSPAVWTLTADGPRDCTLRLVPSNRRAVAVPCGSLQLDTAAGLVITNPPYAMVVDPSSGRIVKRLRVPGQVEAIGGSFVLENSRPSLDAPGNLSLIDLATGTRRSVRWPSILPAIQRISIEPHGPLVAVGFVSVAYPGPQQADDVWLLNTTTATFTHLPGFPAQESIKASGIAWTSDDHLVVVADSSTDTATRVVLGVWQPGQATLPLRAIPTLPGGYSQFAPLAG